MEPCEECGYDYQALAFSGVPDALRQRVAEISVAINGRPGSGVRARPSRLVWSPLEYACHVRDVLLVQRERVLQALVEDTPSFKAMYREERVDNAGYAREDVADLTRELGVAANLLAKLADGMTDEQLARRCIYNYPVATERDIGWVFRHTLHEVVHHEMDIKRGLAVK